MHLGSGCRRRGCSCEHERQNGSAGRSERNFSHVQRLVDSSSIHSNHNVQGSTKTETDLAAAWVCVSRYIIGIIAEIRVSAGIFMAPFCLRI